MNSANTPLFSIITVTWTASAVLPVTLRSVAGQTCREYEHIVMDGNSSDGTPDIARKLGSPELTRVWSEPDSGLYDAMNKAMERARGEYYIFLNAGDTFHSPDTLALIAETIRSGGHPGVVYGQTDIVDSSRRRVADRHLIAPEQLTLRSFANGMVVCHQAFIVNSKVATPFDTSYRYSADYEWCIRCLQHSRLNLYIPHTIIDYLMEGLSTAHRFASLRERFAIMCRYYGVATTVGRHLLFLPRFIRRRRLEKKELSRLSTQK